AVRRALGTMDAAAALGAPVVWTQWPAAHEMSRVSPGDESRLLTHGDSRTLTDDGSLTLTHDASRTPTDDARRTDGPPVIQLRSTYLMFEAQSGVVLIDQHSAHERVLYEKFLSQLEHGHSPSQRLLFPLTLSLAPAESDALDAHRELFQALGFELGEFGG